jgi:transposase-like protein
METSKKQRKHFDNRQKVQALKRHFVEGVAISAICDELGIRVSQFYQWQGQLFEGGERAFDRSEGDQVKVLKNQIENLEKKLTRKDTVLAELLEEHVRLKKSLGDV